MDDGQPWVVKSEADATGAGTGRGRDMKIHHTINNIISPSSIH